MFGDRMYVVVRKDLPLSQIVVQASHAVAEYLLNYRQPPLGVGDWDNGKMVVLGVRSLEELNEIQETLRTGGMSFSVFKETDLDNEATALAFIHRGRCSFLDHLPML